MKKWITVIGTLLIVVVLAAGVVLVKPTQAYSGIPTFSIVSVVTDSKVTVLTNNFPAGYTFKVRMGKYGTLAIGGEVVGTVSSGSGGAFKATFPIPASLKGLAQIAIRMDSTSGGFYAYNWFYNNTAATPTDGGYTGIPTFSIQSVVTDSKVTIKGNSFPGGKSWKVYMGKYGTLGIGGIFIKTVDLGDSFTATFKIPSELYGESRIAIRLESTSGGFYAYNWFWNNTATTGTTTPPSDGGYTGVPTFKITEVKQDAKVTIKALGFPGGKSWKVYMGKYGTLGIGGIYIKTIDAGDGFTATFKIPAALRGETRIAIRLESTSGGYYAYNWFWNSNYP